MSKLLDRQRALCCAAAIQQANACCPKNSTYAGTTFTGGTGNVASTTLTVTAVSSGSIAVGMAFTYKGILNRIVAFGTGSGDTGTYTIGSQTIPDGSVITSTNNNTSVPVPNSYLDAYKTDVAVWGSLVFPGAVAIRGTTVPPESARVKSKTDKYTPPQSSSDPPPCGYFPTGIPFIPPGCPPTPTEILNGSLPKPSTRLECPVTRFEGLETVCSD
jgi:hypothetical protein